MRALADPLDLVYDAIGRGAVVSASMAGLAFFMLAASAFTDLWLLTRTVLQAELRVDDSVIVRLL